MSQPELAPTGLPPAFPGRAAWGTAGALRAWQTAALEQYFADEPRDFLAVATPGAGKTTFALSVAAHTYGYGHALADHVVRIEEPVAAPAVDSRLTAPAGAAVTR